MSTDTASANDLYHQVRGSGPGVLFIPGASGDSGNFGRVAERLADQFTVVTYDRRGNSRSPALPAGQSMSIAAQADDAGALLEAAGVTPAVVFGTSGGGNILLDLVARRPEVIRAALVHEPALIAVRDTAQDATSLELGPIFELAARDPRAAMEAFVRHFTSDETFERLDSEVRERVLGNGANFFANELRAFATYVPDMAAVTASGVPVRVLASRDSGDHQTCVWLAGHLGCSIEYLSGHHAPSGSTRRFSPRSSVPCSGTCHADLERPLRPGRRRRAAGPGNQPRSSCSAANSAVPARVETPSLA